MEMSKETKELFIALIAVQKEVPQPKNDKTNPHFKNDYASLEAVIGVSKDILNKHGLAVIQVLDHVPGQHNDLTQSTTLVHESGQFMSWNAPLTSAPQKDGSANTYFRRYNLQGICGVSHENDDDANHASELPPPPPPLNNRFAVKKNPALDNFKSQIRSAESHFVLDEVAKSIKGKFQGDDHRSLLTAWNVRNQELGERKQND